MDLSFIFPMTRLLPRNIYPIFRVISGTHPLENRWDTGPCHGAPGENKIVLGQPARKLGFRICLKWVKTKPSYGDMTGVSWKIEHDIDLDCWWRQKSMNIMSAFGTIGDLGGGLQRPSPNSCGLPSPHFPFILNSPIYDHFMPIFPWIFPSAKSLQRGEGFHRHMLGHHLGIAVFLCYQHLLAERQAKEAMPVAREPRQRKISQEMTSRSNEKGLLHNNKVYE